MKSAGIIERPTSNRAVNGQIDTTIEEVGQEAGRERLMVTLLSGLLIVTVGGTNSMGLETMDLEKCDVSLGISEVYECN